VTLTIEAMPNFRDVGGRRTGDGAIVRTGVLFRSDQIPPLPKDDARVLAGLGLRYVYDLRTDAERSMLPGDRVPGATHVALDVLADDRQSMPARLVGLLADPSPAESMLGQGRGAAMFRASYREFVTLASARLAFHTLFEGLAAADRLPAMVHCTTGKDRTGWACASLQLLLGVPREAVMEDYLESNRRVLKKYQRHLEAFAAQGGDPSLLEPVLGVRAEYLDSAIDAAVGDYGSILDYFRRGLGLGDASLDALQERFLTDR
jgi:protein-tyrosine phosphatase